MLTITVKMHSVLKKYLSSQNGVGIVYLPEGACIRDLLVKFDLHRGEVEIILINGKLVDETAMVQGGANIEFYPIFGGG